MHQYLRSIGFSQYKREQEVEDLLNYFQDRYMDSARRYAMDGGDMVVELRAQVANTMGICILGTISDDGMFRRQTYYPYIWSTDVSTQVTAQSYRRIDGNLFSALLDDPRVGVTLIFHQDNPFDYLEMVGESKDAEHNVSRLAGFSTNGLILLPSISTMKQAVKTPMEPRPQIPSQLELFEAAKNGNTEAIERVAFEEMSTIAEISNRLKNEDVYSIVDSVFMPQVVECDIYQVVGDIRQVTRTENLITGEGIYDLTLDVNDMIIHVATNEADLEGEPEVGRRFKGRIWLQGRVEY